MSARCETRSVLTPHVGGLLAEKRAMGFPCRTEEPILSRFGGHCLERGLEGPEISRDFLSEWLERSPTEGSRDHAKRVGVAGQLMIYMASMGLRARTPGGLPKGGARSSHVMTGDERSAFFAQVDACRPAGGCAAYRRLAGEYKVLFRVVYCCGLRNSEACGIPSDRVDLDIGASAMAQSKGRKDRVVHVADDLTALCPGCLAWPRGLLGFRPDWFFPSKDPGKPLASTSAGRVFGRFWNATAFAPECSDKPVVHDLRFGLVTDRADRWALDGAGVEAMMPYLSRYVGHKDLQSTYHYIHTSEQLRDVIAKYDVTGSSAIPEVDYGQR